MFEQHFECFAAINGIVEYKQLVQYIFQIPYLFDQFHEQIVFSLRTFFAFLPNNLGFLNTLILGIYVLRFYEVILDRVANKNFSYRW